MRYEYSEILPMMKLVLEQANNKPTIVFTISPEKDKLAAASAQKIFLYSLPDLKVLELIPLHHVHRILWLDNDVFYVVTVSGYVAVWSPEQEKMKRVGKWADSIWSEQDVFFCGKDKFVTSYFRHEISAFDIANHYSRGVFQQYCPYSVVYQAIVKNVASILTVLDFF